MSEASRSRLVPEVDFDRDGKQCGFVRLFHSIHTSAYGFIPIPIVVFRNGPGPTALFISGNHGDEYEGQVALCNLARELDPEMIRGRVILLPMANFHACAAGRRTSPVDDGNLNRSFPGDPEGTVTQQIAFFIEHVLLPKADIVCDLHSGGSSLMYVPTVLMKRPDDPKRFEAQLAALKAFGAPLAYITGGGHGTGAANTLSSAAIRQGPLALGTELGGSGTLTPEALHIAQRGLRNILVYLGILPASMKVKSEETRILDVGGSEYFVYAPESGIFEPVVELGETVQAGQLAGRIHFPETPWAPAAEARFARDGYLLCKRMPGRTLRGDCLFHIGSDRVA